MSHSIVKLHDLTDEQWSALEEVDANASITISGIPKPANGAPDSIPTNAEVMLSQAKTIPPVGGVEESMTTNVFNVSGIQVHTQWWKKREDSSQPANEDEQAEWGLTGIFKEVAESGEGEDSERPVKDAPNKYPTTARPDQIDTEKKKSDGTMVSPDASGSLNFIPSDSKIPGASPLGTFKGSGGSDEHPAPISDLDSMARAIEKRKGDNEYEFINFLGRGGQGEVWRARQKNLARDVAIKIFSAGEATDFLLEAYTSANLDHPNIVPIYDLSVGAQFKGEAPQPLLAMKVVEGKPWHQLIFEDRQREKGTTQAFLQKHLSILIDVANAVAYAHSKGIIHRDLKPSQVVVGAFGVVYLMDWGLAISLMKEENIPKAPHAPGPIHRTIESAANCAGTPAYMAPEQTRFETEGLGNHTDIYLLGAMLYELLTGLPPHHAKNARASFESARQNNIKPLPERYPPSLIKLVESTLASDERLRPANVEAFRDGVEKYLFGVAQRSESEELVKEIEADLHAVFNKEGEIPYDVLSKAEHRLAHAIALWNQNERALQLRNEVLERMARVAIERGDLNLAELQTQALPYGDLQDELLEKIILKRRALSLRHRQRNIAIAACVLLGLAFVFTGAKNLYDQRRANKKMARQLAAGEELVGFILSDLTDKLRRAGKLEYLEETTTAAQDYYESLPADDNTDPARIANRAGVIRQLGDVMHAEGRVKEAAQNYRIAMELIDPLLADSSDENLLAEFISAAIGMANATTAQNRFDEAGSALDLASQAVERLKESGSNYADTMEAEVAESRSSYTAAMGAGSAMRGASADLLELRSKQAAASPEDIEAQLSYILSLAEHGRNLIDTGDVPGATKVLADAEKNLAGLPELDHTDALMQQDRAIIHSSLAGSFLDLGGMPKARLHSKRAFDIYEKLSQRDLRNITWAVGYVDAMSDLGAVYYEIERWEEGLELLNRAYEKSLELRSLSSNHREILAAITYTSIQLAETLMDEANLEGATQTLRETEVVLAEAVTELGVDTELLSLLLDFAFTFADVAAGQCKLEEALQTYHSAEAWINLLDRNTLQTVPRARIAMNEIDLYLGKIDILMRIGDYTEAQKAWGQALVALSKAEKLEETMNLGWRESNLEHQMFEARLEVARHNFDTAAESYRRLGKLAEGYLEQLGTLEEGSDGQTRAERRLLAGDRLEYELYYVMALLGLYRTAKLNGDEATAAQFGLEVEKWWAASEEKGYDYPEDDLTDPEPIDMMHAIAFTLMHQGEEQQAKEMQRQAHRRIMAVTENAAQQQAHRYELARRMAEQAELAAYVGVTEVQTAMNRQALQLLDQDTIVCNFEAAPLFGRLAAQAGPGERPPTGIGGGPPTRPGGNQQGAPGNYQQGRPPQQPGNYPPVGGYGQPLPPGMRNQGRQGPGEQGQGFQPGPPQGQGGYGRPLPPHLRNQGQGGPGSGPGGARPGQGPQQ